MENDQLEGRMLLTPGKLIGHKYRVIEQVSKGSFSNVYKCIDIIENINVIIKCYRSMEEYAASANREAIIMRALNHADPKNQYFISFFGKLIDHNHVCIILQEYGISLFRALRDLNFQPFGTTAIRFILFKVALGVQLLHEIGFIHTDIKSDNILLPPDFDLNLLSYNEGTQSEQSFDDLKSEPHQKTALNLGEKSYKSHRSLGIKDFEARLIDFNSFVSSKHWHTRLASTRKYRAPEILMGLRWGKESDIWSLGCLLVELAYGTIYFSAPDDDLHLFLIQHCISPFPEWMPQQCTIAVIKNRFCRSSPINIMECDQSWKEFLAIPSIYEVLNFDTDLLDLASKMLRTDPHERISIDEILAHSFFDICRT